MTATDEWQQLKTGLTADSAGYVTLSLVNESGTPAYFDDLALRLVDGLYMQENHYDPFGLNLVGIEASSGNDSKFQFNGQEKQEEFGLNWTHMGARFYDPQLGRWHAIDELADFQEEYSPYQFAWNNPANYSDPTGYFPEDSEFAQHDPPSKQVLLDGVYVVGVSEEREKQQQERDRARIEAEQFSIHQFFDEQIPEKQQQARQQAEGMWEGFKRFAKESEPILTNTVFNPQKFPVWLKPEKNTGPPFLLLPGASTRIRVDGITHPKHPGQVYKVGDHFDWFSGIRIGKDDINIGCFGLENQINQKFNGGWRDGTSKEAKDVEGGWIPIFEKAKGR